MSPFFPIALLSLAAVFPAARLAVVAARRDAAGAQAREAELRRALARAGARVRQIRETTVHRDRLTGLPSRATFARRLKATIGAANRDGARCAVLAVDLDRFETINDTLGHAVGDLVLREVAVRLQQMVRGGDLIARPGGDEFSVLLPRIRDAREARLVADRIADAFAARPMTVAGRELFVDLSVGAALYPDHGRDPGAVIAHAGCAMHRAKAAGGRRSALYDREMEADSARRLLLENELRHAIARSELRLMFQPIVEVKTRRVVGAEALVRWHRDQDVIGPSAFVAIAEETGAIVAIDRWVVREACVAAGRIRRHAPGFRVAVNLSPRDLREPDAVGAIAALLAEHDLPGDALTVEVTEQAVLDGLALRALCRLAEIGVRVALDDAAAGYSSLASSKRMPIAALKIDRDWLRDVADNADDQAIVRSIAGVADAFGLAVIAEGVETEAQLAFVESLGCEQAQGYLFGPPVAFDALEALVPAGPALATLGAPHATDPIPPVPGGEAAHGYRYKSNE